MAELPPPNHSIAVTNPSELDWLRTRLAEVEAERDAAAAVGRSMIANLAAENARLRQVVDKAEVWRLRVAGQILGSHEMPLRDAVDAYHAGQKRSERVIDELELHAAGPDGAADFTVLRSHSEHPASPPGSTLSQDQAESAVASTNTAQAQRGVQGGSEARWKLISHNLPPGTPHTFDEHTGELSWAQSATADPPGLDEAIEAAAPVVCWDWSDVGHWDEASEQRRDVYRRSAANILRAAAPALRAGALREAAKITNCHDDSELLTDMAAEVERVDRIGGAT